MCSSPCIQRSPAARYPLEHNPLTVPDPGLVTDGVQAAAVRIARTRHVQDSANNPEHWKHINTDCGYLAPEQAVQLPYWDLLVGRGGQRDEPGTRRPGSPGSPGSTSRGRPCTVSPIRPHLYLATRCKESFSTTWLMCR